MPVKMPAGGATRKDFIMIDPREILLDEGWNYRTYFDPDKMEELTLSIMEVGVEVPVHVWVDKDNRAHLINGERRRRASIEAIARVGQAILIPAIIKPANGSIVERMFTALTTNDGVEPLPIERADAYRRLLAWGTPVETIAKRRGCTVETIKRTLELLNAAPAVQEAMAAREISTNEAREIMRQSPGDIEAQQRELEAAKARKVNPEARKEAREARKQEEALKRRGQELDRSTEVPEGVSGDSLLERLAGLEKRGYWSLNYDRNSPLDIWSIEYYFPGEDKADNTIHDTSSDLGKLLARVIEKVAGKVEQQKQIEKAKQEAKRREA